MYDDLSIAAIFILSGTFSFRISSLSNSSSMKVAVYNGSGAITFLSTVVVLSDLSLTFLKVEECDYGRYK